MSDIEPIYVALGRRIHEIRTGRHPRMTQGEVAELVGLPRSAISAIEGGRQRILTHTLLGICEALDIQPSDVLKNLDQLDIKEIHADEKITNQDLREINNLFEVAAKS